MSGLAAGEGAGHSSPRNDYATSRKVGVRSAPAASPDFKKGK